MDKEPIITDTKKKESLGKSIMIFLNSSFGLWLISAIFISGGVKIYEDYKADKEQEKKLTDAVSKLDVEIGYRYSRILVNLFELTDKNPDSVALAKSFKESDVKKVALSINSTKNYSGEFLYAEYSNFGLLSLIAEEKRILENLNQSPENLNKVISDITGLEVFYQVEKIHFNDIQSTAIAIEEKLILDRWKNNGFYFLDGGTHNPFP